MPEKEYRLSDFDFHLPENLLAEFPAKRRDGSRLLVVSKSAKNIAHHRFTEIVHFLNPGDLLVLNNTKVIPAKLEARKVHPKNVGARVKILLVNPYRGSVPSWNMLLDPIRKIRNGTKLQFANGIIGVVDEILSEKEARVAFPEIECHEELRKILFEIGEIPLPPYIKRRVSETDSFRYQTVFATNEGALAAPTAGLHFTDQIFNKLESKGVDKTFLTLDIGMGTFNPIYKEDLSKVELHRESFHIPAETADKVNGIQRPKKVLAVGTTTLRALETASDNRGMISAGSSQSELFIKPGYEFKSKTALLTNFHTPKSSLLMMISAYLGYEFTREVYAEAIGEKYRFFSYGDAMLILD